MPESAADNVMECTVTIAIADVMECDVEGLATNLTGCTVKGLSKEHALEVG